MESLIDIEDFPGRSDRHDNQHHPDRHDHYDDGDHIHDDAAAVMTMTRLTMIIAMTIKTSMGLFVMQMMFMILVMNQYYCQCTEFIVKLQRSNGLTHQKNGLTNRSD